MSPPLHPSLDPYRQNHRRRDTYTCCAWTGGTFFQLCCRVSFWFWLEIGFGYILMYLEYHTVLVLCQFLCFWREIVFGTYVLTIQLLCCVSFLVLAGNGFWCYLRTECTIQLCGCVLKKWLFGFFFLEKQLASQNIFLIKSEVSITTYLFLVFFKSTSL